MQLKLLYTKQAALVSYSNFERHFLHLFDIRLIYVSDEQIIDQWSTFQWCNKNYLQAWINNGRNSGQTKFSGSILCNINIF